jgi:hypothetical protein
VSALATAVRLELGGCRDSSCIALYEPLHGQLATGRYDVCSVLPMPDSLDEWRSEHRTARKRANRAERLGFHFAEIERHRYADDIYEINTSLEERQGRPMSAGYHERPSASPDAPSSCPRHVIRRYGVLSGRRLVAYLWLYRSGDLALVSSILGHGDYLRFDIMYLLFQGMLEHEIPHGGFVVYNRHDSGTEGLRYFKTRCGFSAMEVEWAL